MRLFALLLFQITITQVFFAQSLIFIDFENEDTLLKFSPKESYTANYNPLYIGPITDSIKINPPVMAYMKEFARFFPYSVRNSPKHGLSIKSNLTVYIDTTQVISYRNIYDTKIKNNHYLAYPVLIQSNDSSYLEMGLENQIYLQLEAKDKKGNWHPIGKWYDWGCGNGLKHILLPPYQLLICALPIHHGDFKTSLRLRFGEHCSNEFQGVVSSDFIPSSSSWQRK